MRHIGLAFFFVVILVSSCSSTKHVATLTSTPADTNFHLYLLVGQSNMAGRGKLDAMSKIVDSAIFAFDSTGRWVYAVDPVHFDKPVAGVGPGISFAKAMLTDTHDSSIRIGLIPCAVGGTSIDLWFEGQRDPVTQSHPYDDAIRRAKAAMEDGLLKGIIWHQGEADNTPEKAVDYLERLLAVIQNFRADIGVEVPFILGETGYFTDVQIINDIIQEVPKHMEKVVVVKADGLTDMGDKLHFDAYSAREFGKRYAEAMKQF